MVYVFRGESLLQELGTEVLERAGGEKGAGGVTWSSVTVESSVAPQAGGAEQVLFSGARPRGLWQLLLMVTTLHASWMQGWLLAPAVGPPLRLGCPWGLCGSLCWPATPRGMWPAPMSCAGSQDGWGGGSGGEFHQEGSSTSVLSALLEAKRSFCCCCFSFSKLPYGSFWRLASLGPSMAWQI